jgi:protein-disulfide isomerase-like protein with CxxC motif
MNADSQPVAQPVYRWNDVTPEGNAARLERIKAAAEARGRRSADLQTARALIRKHGLNNDGEALAFLQTVHAAMPDSSYRETLLELLTDMDSEMSEPEPTLDELRALGLA